MTSKRTIILLIVVVLYGCLVVPLCGQERTSRPHIVYIPERYDSVRVADENVLSIPYNPTRRPDNLMCDGYILADAATTLLYEMGQWMQVNGESIYGTRPWKIWGQGKLRVVKKEDVLYVTSFEWPESGKVIVPFMRQQEDVHVRKIQLLGANTDSDYRFGKGGLEIDLASQKPCNHAWVFKLTCKDL